LEICHIICLSCGKSTHSYDQCPFIHYIPDKDFLIKKHLHDEGQQRNANFSRKKQKKFNALINYDFVQSEICNMNSELFSIEDDFLEFPETEFLNFSMKNSKVMREMKENEENPRICALENNFFESDKFSDPSPKNNKENDNFQWITRNKTSYEIKNVEKNIEREKKNDKDRAIQSSIKNLVRKKTSKNLEINEEKHFEKENNEIFNQKLFDYGFEIFKNYNLYFIEGNAQKIVNKMQMQDVDKIKTVVLSPKLKKRARERFSISKAKMKKTVPD